MTDYNNGEWHGWNGGECPVHPKSVIEGYWRCDDKTHVGSAVYNLGRAGGANFYWDGGTRLQVFRVVTEYIAPRECWTFGSQHFKTANEAKAFKAKMIADRPDLGFETNEIIHMREVTK